MDKKTKFIDKLIGKKQSLTKRTLGILGIAIVLFAISFLAAIWILSARDRQAHDIRETETVVNSMTASIRANMLTYKDISRLVLLNDAVCTYLRTEETDAGLRNDAKYGVMNVINVCNDVDSVYIFRNDGHYMSTGRGEYILDHELMATPEWQNLINRHMGGAVVTINGNGSIYRRNGKAILSIGRTIFDIYTQKKVGIMQFNISTSMLEQICIAQQNREVCILTDEGRCLAGSEELAALYDTSFSSNILESKKMQFGKKKRMVSGCRVDDMPLIVMCAAQNEPQTISWENTVTLLNIFLAFVLSFSLAALFITKNITEPLNAMTTAIEESRDSKFLKKIDVPLPNNEIGQLGESYNRLVEHLYELFDQVIETEKSVQKAEMRVLHEQLKPHFLYNSLETISYMAFEAGAENVHSALETLGSFYRNFFSKGEREITIKAEISIIRDYLALQKLRYGDIINDEYDIAENTQELMIPKLILQPLVENSIYHGIRLTGEPGTISIKTWLDGCDLHIVVRDTGIGMSEEAIRKVLSKEQVSEEDTKHSGFGLRGTIERIRYYCNNDDVITIRSEVGEYTEIELRIIGIAKGREAKNV